MGLKGYNFTSNAGLCVVELLPLPIEKRESSQIDGPVRQRVGEIAKGDYLVRVNESNTLPFRSIASILRDLRPFTAMRQI